MVLSEDMVAGIGKLPNDTEEVESLAGMASKIPSTIKLSIFSNPEPDVTLDPLFQPQIFTVTVASPVKPVTG